MPLAEIILNPFAPTLLESLRAVGYSFESAIADLVDNSISADADRIRIEFRTDPIPYVAILDNGTGMNANELVQAMRHGSRNPRECRTAKDLGRFGLGMKTASLSQCRRFTVISMSSSGLSGARWDLDVVEERKDWVLQTLTEQEIQAFPHVTDLVQTGCGTLVVWECLDRALAGETSQAQGLNDRIDLAREHVALVFHRFLAGEPGINKIFISINGGAVSGLDPYLRKNPSTQPLQIDPLDVEGGKVTITPYILPHKSHLSQADLALAGGEDGLRKHQGFYVYRNHRLINWGTWFRLVRHNELNKLARVQVDIPNTLDHLWTIDIKKSTANPPEVVREGLRRTVERIVGRSREVYLFRKRRVTTNEITHSWDRLKVRGGIRYSVNREHPLVVAISSVIDEKHNALLERLLQTLESTFPCDALYADMASERKITNEKTSKETEEFLRDTAHRLFDAVGLNTVAGQQLLVALPTMEPFSAHLVVTSKILENIRNGHPLGQCIPH